MFQDIKTRKLTTKELFQFSMNIYGKYFIYILCICLAVYGPLYTIFSLTLSQLTVDPMVLLNGSPNKLMGTAYFLVGISIIFKPLAVSAFTYIGKQSMNGEPVTFSGIMDVSLMKWHKLFITALCFTVVIFLSSFLLLPAIYFGISFGFYAHVVSISDKRDFGALAVSRQLVKGRWWATMIFLFLMSLFTIMINFSIAFVPTTSSEIMNVVLGIVINTFSEVVTSYFQFVIVVYFLNIFYMKNSSSELERKTDV